MNLYLKSGFMARYGTRQHALDAIHTGDSYDAAQAISNPNLTNDDLIRLSYHNDKQVADAAGQEALKRGVENVSWSALKDPSQAAIK